jgi:peroxiredoxin
VQNLKDKPFALIGVNVTGSNAEQLKETMAKEKLPWRSFADTGPIFKGPIASKWSLTATPTLYVIDPAGVIRYKWVGSPSAKVIDAALEELIGAMERAGKNPTN